MECPSCQHDNPAGARFCNHCGAPIAPTCSDCGRDNPPGSRFCNHCGAALAGASSPAGEVPTPAETSPASRDPREFTPQHLAQRILTSRNSLEGERKHVTVVFMDVVGFTTFAEPTDPERVREIINRCIETILDQVHEYEGTVNQFTGDGVMALFGAPIALEDAPRRAVSAALAVHRALEPLRNEVRETHGTDFQMRVGIHSGTVVVGSIGNDLRMEYTAVGDTTNLASRLEQLAEPGTVLISEAMQRQVAPFFELRDRGTVGVKGRHAPVRVYEVLAERAAQARFEGAISAGLTEFVGRERELDTLLAGVASARAGRGQIAFLVGDAGIGKSRLVYELRQSLQESARGDYFWMEGRCASFGRNTAFGPIADALRRAYRIDDGDDDDAAVEKVMAAEAHFGGELNWTLPYVRALLSLPVGDAVTTEAFNALDASTRRSEMQRALEARLLRAASERPLIFVIEDLHWIDNASEEILTALADSIPSSRVMLILTHRPGYQQPLGDRSFHTRIALQALQPNEMAKMARSILDAADFEEALHHLIEAKAEGNPFFIEELTRSLLEEEGIELDGARAVLARDLSELSIPDRIQDVVASRIDRLGEEHKRAIQVASVIGREFMLRLLARVNDAQHAPDAIVDELRALELVYQKASYPEAVFMFKHALTHDVAYESVLFERRKELHRAVGEAIEDLYRDRLAEHYEALAHHFSRGEDWEAALRFHDLAAEKAGEAFANKTAAEHLRAALAIVERVPVASALHSSLYSRLGYALSVISDFNASTDAYEQGANKSEDPSEQVRCLCMAAFWSLWSHDYERAHALNDRARAIATGEDVDEARVMLNAGFFGYVTEGTRIHDPEVAETILRKSEGNGALCSLAHTLIGESSEWMANYRLALAQQERAMEIARRERAPDLIIVSGWFIAKAACCTGDYTRALHDLRDAVDLADRIGDRAWKTRLLNTLGWALAETGRPDLALEPNRRSTELGEELVKLAFVAGAPEIYGNAAINLACNQIALGQVEEAGDQLAAVREDMEGSDDPWMKWRYQMHLWDALGRHALAQGDPEATLTFTERELDAARGHGARKLEARALELRGRALVTMDDRERALASLGAAQEIGSQIGYPPVLWRTDALLGELARRLGDRDGEARFFERAATRIRSLVVPTLDGDARAGLERLAEESLRDPLGVYR